MWRVSSGNISKDSEPHLIVPQSKKPSNLNTMFSSPIPTTAYCGYLLKQDFSVVNHNFSSGSEKNKRGGINIKTEDEMSIGAARWTPTPEQLYALEEIYQTGTRTPSATQIQQIAVRLRRFGKIEGKNVFYWFQNHKARERQKRRRQQLHNQKQNLHVNVQSLDVKFSGLRRTEFEGGQAKNWVSPSDCSTLSEESVVSLATAEVAKGEMDERIQFEDTRLQLKTSSVEQQMMEFSNHAGVKAQNDHKKVLLMPHRDIMTNTKLDERRYQTLELFPAHRIYDHDDQCQMTADAPKIDDHSQVGSNTSNSIKFAPTTHFFEFLPLKI